MPGSVYGADSHKEAFETYYDTRTWTSVQRKLGITTPTLHEWASKDFPCKWGCPYHGWDELIEERGRMVEKTVEVSAEKRRDLTAGEVEQVVYATTEYNRKDKRQLLSRIVRSDFERIGHWELLYAKIYYDLTGLVIDVPGMDISRLLEKIEDRGAAVRGGLHFTNADTGMKALAFVTAEINKLRGSVSPAHEEDDDMEQELSLDELNRMRLQLKALPPPTSERYDENSATG